MEAYRILFDQIEWESPHPGVRFKAVRHGSTQVRLVEFTPEFVEREWCEKGHTGFVVAGELEIDFSGHVVRFLEGSALLRTRAKIKSSTWGFARPLALLCWGDARRHDDRTDSQ